MQRLQGPVVFPVELLVRPAVQLGEHRVHVLGHLRVEHVDGGQHALLSDWHVLVVKFL